MSNTSPKVFEYKSQGGILVKVSHRVVVFFAALREKFISCFSVEDLIIMKSLGSNFAASIRAWISTALSSLNTPLFSKDLALTGKIFFYAKGMVTYG